MDHWLALNLVVTDPRCRTRTRIIAVSSEHDNINTVIITPVTFYLSFIVDFLHVGYLHPICVQKYLARQGNYFTGLLNATFLLGVTT